MKKDTNTKELKIINNFFLGFGLNAIKNCVFHPLVKIKIYIMMNSTPRNRGFSRYINQIIRNDCLIFWKGEFIYSCIKSSTYIGFILVLNDLICKNYPKRDFLSSKFISGGLAGVITNIFYHPLDVINEKYMRIDDIKSMSLINKIQHCIKTDGFLSLYKQFFISGLIKFVYYGGILGGYGQLKEELYPTSGIFFYFLLAITAKAFTLPLIKFLNFLKRKIYHEKKIYKNKGLLLIIVLYDKYREKI